MKNLLTSAFTLLAIASLAQKQPIKLNLTTGTTYWQSSVTQSTIKQTMGEQDMTMETSQSIKVGYTVVAKNDNVYDVEARYNKMAVNFSSAMGSTAYNSDSVSSENDAMGKMLRAMMNEKYLLRITDKGELIGVRNHEQAYAAIEKALADVPEDEKAALLNTVKPYFGEAQIKEQFEKAMRIYPAQHVGAGDSWTIKSSVTSTFELNDSSTYTLQSVDKNSYTIDVVGDLSTTASETEMNGIKMSYGLKGMRKGQLVMDRKTGWITSYTGEQTLGGAITMKAGGALPEDMVMPMQVNGTTTISNK